jgi:hypothetical protein
MINWNKKIKCKDGNSLQLISKENDKGTDFYIVNRGTCEYSVFPDGKPADPEMAKNDSFYVQNV